MWGKLATGSQMKLDRPAAQPSAFGQTKPRVFYHRPAKPEPYRAPMKPLVRLADPKPATAAVLTGANCHPDNNSRAQVT